ncbi:MAG: hypothetical protein FDW93_07365 [Bergeyella sp.]|nr:hypothetical protein [Bergeyella sp.]
MEGPKNKRNRLKPFSTHKNEAGRIMLGTSRAVELCREAYCILLTEVRVRISHKRLALLWLDLRQLG